MADRKVLDVEQVAFSGHIVDDRSPEDFPLPACMASLLTRLNGERRSRVIHAHGRDYTQRIDNYEILAATGMAYGLLWHAGYCLSCTDLTQVNDHDDTIDRAFRWAGYEYEILQRDEHDQRELLDRVRRSIDAGAPVLAFGIFDAPECAIVAGYDGGSLIGWSPFQAFERCDTEENGMFRRADWYEKLWKLVVPGRRVGRSLTDRDVLRRGLRILRQTQAEGYAAGRAAYDAWIATAEGLPGLSDEERGARYRFHHQLVGTLAEARCWGADFMDEHGAPDAARHFKNIHDLCWKVWGAAGDDGARAARDPGVANAIAALLREIRREDGLAEDALSRLVGEDE
ncbi:MAG: hypothetical protein GX558_10010 [Clostridiales bacterium]|nr:hypothetical protein [Clostridiales bacterium]